MTLKTTKLRDAISFSLAVGMIAGSGAAFAQDQAPASEEPTTLDRIEVTGSRIKRAEVEGAVPVIVISREQIQASGETSVSDYLRSQNFSSTGQFRPQSGSSAQAGAFADLRGLGAQRTLVLVDGFRAPNAPFTGQGQDLNVIPLAAVERIEVLTDGASAIYGADAVGGVINIITRKDFNGATVTIEASTPEWGPTEGGSAVIGVSGDRGRMIGGFSTNRRAMIFTRDRPWYTPGASVFSNNYISVDPTTGAITSGRTTSQGNPDIFTPLPGGCTNPGFYINPNNDRCAYDFNSVAADEAAITLKSFFANGEFYINDDWSIYLRTTVANSKSFGRYASTPGTVRIEPDSAANPSPGDITYLYHRFAAAGNRDTTTDSNVYDINLGFNGRLTEDTDINFGVRYNDYKYNELGRNFIVTDLAEQAINDGFYNIYDPVNTPESVLDSIKATIPRDSSWLSKQAYANVTFNNLFEMGGGASALVLGTEYRREEYQDNYDSLSEGGQILGSAGNSAGGTRDLAAAYFEWLFPITSTFEANLAGRYESYSDFGKKFSPKVALRWQPLDSLTLRGSVGKGFVAPTLDVMTQQTAFSADTVFDPQTCIAFGDAPAPGTGDRGATESLAAYCNRTGGNNGVQVNAFREANPNIGPEESTQYQLGVVWDATDWLNFTLDYYNIEIKDRIAFFSSQELVDIDIGNDPRPFPTAPCSLVRNASGAIDEVHNCNFNQGIVETDGFDFATRTNFDMGEWGNLKNQLLVTYVNEFTIDGGDDIVKVQEGFPQVRATLANTLDISDFTFGWNVRYIGPHGEDNFAYSSYTTHDLQVSVATPWNGRFTLGVLNAGDKMPELIASGGRPFDFDLYDAYGRQPYFRYEQNF